MALQKNINLPAGTNLSFKYTDYTMCTKNIKETLENAYIKIDNITGSKSNIIISIAIYNFKNGTVILRKSYNFVPDISENAKNFIKQGYEYLKTLDEYKDAINLLDEGQTI